MVGLSDRTVYLFGVFWQRPQRGAELVGRRTRPSIAGAVLRWGLQRGSGEYARFNLLEN
jgi:hypothetical protein